MAQHTHAILSDLHKLLGTCSATDFMEASNYSGVSKLMKQVLRALSQEADPHRQPSPESPSFVESGTVRARQRARSARRENASGFDQTNQRFVDLMRRSGHFDSKAAVLSFARVIGVKLQARPKESKERLTRRLAVLVESLPELRRAQVLSDLMEGGKTQTQGWIDVIHNANR